MTREEAYAELLARLEHDVQIEHMDYCIGEDRVRDLLERFRTNEPVHIDLTPEAVEALKT